MLYRCQMFSTARLRMLEYGQKWTSMETGTEGSKDYKEGDFVAHNLRPTKEKVDSINNSCEKEETNLMWSRSQSVSNT